MEKKGFKIIAVGIGKYSVLLLYFWNLKQMYANMYVKVQDTGIEMKKEDMKNLFTQFQRLDEKRNRHIEGTGLGMSYFLRRSSTILR